MNTVFCLDCTKLIGCKCDQEPRGSRMPSHLPTLDPEFIAALERVPEEAGKEREETNCR